MSADLAAFAAAFAPFSMVLLAALLGAGATVLIEARLLQPRPSSRRPWPCWAVHLGLFALVYTVPALLLGRPWFAAAAVVAAFLLLVLVNNAKFKALREPFIFQDYEYFTDAMRHPRLYIPFLGWPRLLAAVATGVAAISLGIWGEAVPAARFQLTGQLGGLLLVAGAGLALLIAGARRLPPPSLQPVQDMIRLGLLAGMWLYARAERKPPQVQSPFAAAPTLPSPPERPHLVAVQSESFFDIRRLCAAIRPDVLENFDQLRAESLSWGRLAVPAWGANTVRTEFAFLGGLDEADLGVHRFNPYRALAAGWEVASLASYLKGLGYRTICIHPYPASFYRRARVLPSLGFVQFLDIESFSHARRYGPYVSDAAVARRISELLEQAREPLFIFAITMENHGPLHLERPRPRDVARSYVTPPAAPVDDLTVYLRHLRNADHMMGRLRRRLLALEGSAGLCWFGDHVPILPQGYRACGTPDGTVDFVLWHNRAGIQQDIRGNNRQDTHANRQDIHASVLGSLWLRSLGLLD